MTHSQQSDDPTIDRISREDDATGDAPGTPTTVETPSEHEPERTTTAEDSPEGAVTAPEVAPSTHDVPAEDLPAPEAPALAQPGSEPTESAESSESAEPTESSELSEPPEPSAPTESSEPSEPTESTELSEPSAPLAPEPVPLVPTSPATAAARPPLPTAMVPRPLKKATHSIVAPPAHSTSLAEAARFARVEDDGHVFLIVDGAEHAVGQYPDATREEALAYFVRKYDDVASQVALLEQRVQAKAPSSDMTKTAKHLRTQVGERKIVGDVLALEARIDALLEALKGLERTERAAQEELKAQELAAREAIVAEAEELSGRDPSTVQWKASSTRMNELFELWKVAQKSGPRLGRGTEDALWKRFRSARTVFDRHRRAYFSQLDTDNAEAKQAKEALITRAEELSGSTDWGQTAAEYRRLMDEWKASKRASRKDDDALWARFRAAQDRFFEARKSTNEAVDEEYAGNLVTKEVLLEEARQILPIRNLAAAKKTLQSVRDRWDEAGKVPRADMARVDAGLREVEDAIRAADDEHWTKTNPETKARTNSALSQLEATIAQLREDLAGAERAGDAKKIATAREALAAREQWLEMLQRSAQDFS